MRWYKHTPPLAEINGEDGMQPNKSTDRMPSFSRPSFKGSAETFTQNALIIW